MIPRNLLPSELRYFVAGGFAACPALGGDTDIWVTVPTHELESTRNQLLEHLHGRAFDKVTTETDDRSFESYPGASDKFMIRKVAKVEQNGRLFHVLVTDGLALDVLDTFDISTHMVAITDEGVVVTGSWWTPTFLTPLVLKDTPTTPARLEKICTRYQLANPNNVIEAEVLNG